MLKVALTGGIGSGKSEIGAIFAQLGAIVIDSDQLSREVIERGTPGFDEVVASFGDEILKDGNINRVKLGEIVFAQPKNRALLESIIHPKVRAAFNEIAASLDKDAVLINEIPLLVETNSKSAFDKIIAINAPIEVRKQRLRSKGFLDSEIDRRIAAQVTDTSRSAIADYVIENNSSLESLHGQIENIYKELQINASSN
mgnify:FL=1